MDHFRHVNGFRLPRTISTGATNGRQYSVDRRDRIMDYYKGALYEDCRINAYPDFDALKQQKHIPQDYKPTPDHLFIDLDRDSFDTDEQLESALQTTLKNISKYIVGGDQNAAGIRSGNGYHVHVSLKWHNNTALEEMTEFANFADQDLATRFIRWAERELTEGLADQHHNPSIKSSMFRVPGTINSKARDAGKDPIVKVINMGSWIFGSHFFDSVIPYSNVRSEFVMKFHSHLMQELIDDKVAQLERRQRLSSGLLRNCNSIVWIDKLLQTGVEDNRKCLLFWVLAPYLITVKGLDYDRAYCILDAWLDKCNEVRRLEPDRTSFRYRLRYCLDTAENQERKPIKFDTFKEYYPDIYNKVNASEGA